MTTDQVEEARRAEADAEGLFQQLIEAEGLPNSADLESSPIIQRLPSSVEQVEDISILDEGAKRVTVSPENLSPDDLNQMPRNSKEGGNLTVAGQTFTGSRIVFRTDTGKPVPVLTYFLPTVLKKVRDDGKLAFTLRDPGFRPPKGQYPCYLNSKAPEAENFHRMGFPECPMGELPTETDRDDHMRNKHQAEWRRIEDIRVRSERVEDRESMHMMREALALSLGNQTIPSPSLSAPVVKAAAPVVASSADTKVIYKRDTGEAVTVLVDELPQLLTGLKDSEYTAVAPVAASSAETESDFHGGIAIDEISVKSPAKEKKFSASCEHCDKVSQGHSQKQADHFMTMHSKKHVVKEG